MKKQVLSLEQMKRLHELGLDTSQASMEYIEDNNGKILCISKENEHNIKDIEEGLIICETLTLQDILDLLPKEIEKENRNYQLEMFRNPQRYFVSYYWLDNLLISLNEVEFIDAAYEMLCWCIENGYVGTCCS